MRKAQEEQRGSVTPKKTPLLEQLLEIFTTAGNLYLVSMLNGYHHPHQSALAIVGLRIAEEQNLANHKSILRNIDCA